MGAANVIEVVLKFRSDAKDAKSAVAELRKDIDANVNTLKASHP